MSSASSSKPSSFCVQKKAQRVDAARAGACTWTGAVFSRQPPAPLATSPRPSYPLPLPRHATARGELWAAAGLRVASAPRAAATVAARGSRGPFFPPRRRLPLRHLAAHERCELLLRLRARLLRGWQGPDALAGARSGCADASPSRSPRCVLARAHAAAGGARFCESPRCPESASRPQLALTLTATPTPTPALTRTLTLGTPNPNPGYPELLARHARGALELEVDLRPGEG
jgi:hypothetical protein